MTNTTKENKSRTKQIPAETEKHKAIFYYNGFIITVNKSHGFDTLYTL